jgi:hypothetical protein
MTTVDHTAGRVAIMLVAICGAFDEELLFDVTLGCQIQIRGVKGKPVRWISKVRSERDGSADGGRLNGHAIGGERRQ